MYASWSSTSIVDDPSQTSRGLFTGASMLPPPASSLRMYWYWFTYVSPFHVFISHSSLRSSVYCIMCCTMVLGNDCL